LTTKWKTPKGGAAFLHCHKHLYLGFIVPIFVSNYSFAKCMPKTSYTCVKAIFKQQKTFTQDLSQLEKDIEHDNKTGNQDGMAKIRLEVYQRVKKNWTEHCMGEAELVGPGKLLEITFRELNVPCPAPGTTIFGNFLAICHDTVPRQYPGNFFFESKRKETCTSI
jgi:hypothetical protein